jgi:sugar phosphate isomerase/epimerase
MKFAVFTVSIPEWTPDVAVGRLKAMGYDGVEWRVRDPTESPGAASFWGNNQATLPLSTLIEDAPAWRQLTAEAGLEMPSIGTYVACDDLESVERGMLGAKALGVPQLRVTVPTYDGIGPFRSLFDSARAHYRAVADLAAQHGVKALVELHHRSITPSASAARMFLDGLDPDHVGVIHDAGNMVYEGYETHRLALEMLGPYLAHVHIKNARWFPVKYHEDGSVEWKCDWAPVGKGIINQRALFVALRAVGYDGWIGIEDFSAEQKLEQRLQGNLDYLKRLAVETAVEAAG